jgi:hypothetical protein
VGLLTPCCPAAGKRGSPGAVLSFVHRLGLRASVSHPPPRLRHKSPSKFRTNHRSLATDVGGLTDPAAQSYCPTTEPPRNPVLQGLIQICVSIGPKPYRFVGFGDMHGPKPYKFKGFGDMHGPKPYKFKGLICVCCALANSPTSKAEDTKLRQKRREQGPIRESLPLVRAGHSAKTSRSSNMCVSYARRFIGGSSLESVAEHFRQRVAEVVPQLGIPVPGRIRRPAP